MTELQRAQQLDALAAEQMARASIPTGSRPADLTRQQQDLVNQAGDNRTAAHKIRQTLKRHPKFS